MATAASKALCSTCGNENGQVTCEGCSKVFCLNDFTGHRQELDKQFEEIEVTRNLFRQTLTEKISQPGNHVLIEQIDKWETESMMKIQQTAEEARKILLKHTAQLITKIENKLNQLTDQLQQGRKKNEFSEPDLGEWKKELAQMQNELDNSSNITVRQGQTPLVPTITVDISDDSHNMKQSGTTQVVMQNLTVFCSFCEEQFTSQEAMVDHLMMCGNKTDQCRNCKTFVRRAVLAYHYENNCANPDALTIDDEIDKTARQSERPLITVRCEYCQQHCDRANAKTHKETCLRYPANRLKNYRPFIEELVNQKLDRSRQSGDSNDDARIPCEYCNEAVPWHLYENHTEACRKEEHKQGGREARYSLRNILWNIVLPNISASSTESPACQYCGKPTRLNGLYHNPLMCPQNPQRRKS